MQQEDTGGMPENREDESKRAETGAPAVRLRQLMEQQERVVSVLHPPSAHLARIMEKAGCEVGFVGTGSVVGAYTGLADVGTATMMECVTISGWIAQSVNFPIIMDGDTGHGGIMAVRRMVRECIRAGIAGIRIDDQPIEGKRRTGDAGIEVAPLDQVIARYRAAVDMKNEIDPNFVVMAQCYARDAVGFDLPKTLDRLRAYREEAGVDWVQLESPHSVDEIRHARAAVKGPFSFMKGKLPRYLSLDEHKDLGVNLAWLPSFTHHIAWAAVWDFMQEFQSDGIAAWERFADSRKANPYPIPFVGPEGEGATRQQALEERYFRGVPAEGRDG
ncbi:isocitrate lyase/PEP mutase family protein [Shinella sp. CPCC 100929]|uniref:Isocitrate lyase/PEP mutase family protein n=1 Tax=Shinella lacus TaxID=2654216 RepID=A0ABT1QZP9_9HYPH|nr:isocitrate lyase/PEP mutase family protein [Shinella lacus]